MSVEQSAASVVGWVGDCKSPLFETSTQPTSSLAGARAFTLIEVLVSVAIFIMLAGGIFSAVSVAVTASADVSEAQLATARMDAFQRFVRVMFLNLPADASIDLRIRQEAGKGAVVEMLVWPAPEIADFGGAGARSDGLALAARPDGAGAFTICLANFDASEEDTARRDAELESLTWLPILPEVRTLRWRFGEANGTPLVETWKPEQGRPSMVDLELTRLDGSVLPLQFWLPPIADDEGGPGAGGAGSAEENGEGGLTGDEEEVGEN